MIQHSTQGESHPVTSVKMTADEKVALCRCFGSKKFPFCDGSHKHHPGKGPVIVEVVAGGEKSAPREGER